jgi:hypothetical protein
MTRQQAEFILGKPPGDYATRPNHAKLTPADPEALTDIWTTDDGAVVIFYDVRGIVTGSAAAGSGIDDRPSKLIALLDRIRSWFF